MRVSLLTERTRIPAKGLCGGNAGGTGYVWLNGRAVDNPKSVIEVEEHDWLELALPGGGGFGCSRQGDPAAAAGTRASPIGGS
jgi:N-methylhydantoinase B